MIAIERVKVDCNFSVYAVLIYEFMTSVSFWETNSNCMERKNVKTAPVGIAMYGKVWQILLPTIYKFIHHDAKALERTIKDHHLNISANFTGLVHMLRMQKRRLSAKILLEVDMHWRKFLRSIKCTMCV